MMVPRSYPYLQHSPPSPRSSSSEKMAPRTTRNLLSPRTANCAEKPAAHSTRSIPTSVPSPLQPAATMLPQSEPVVIPRRTPPRSANSTQTVRMRGQNGGRPSRSSREHTSGAIPPAVAALLAVTTIPKMPARRRKLNGIDRSISMDELIHEWRQDDSEGPLSVSGSPLDLLLGRVDESESEYGSLQSMEQEQASLLTTRSMSTDSLSTLPPSLDYDGTSYSSHWDNLSTPDSVGRKSIFERKEKLVSSPPKEDCVLDHPLLHFGSEECDEVVKLNVADSIVTMPSSTKKLKSSFKSNLTASLQALKLAAKSFSNFTAPSIPPDDFLTRSLLSPSFTNEMRPKQLEGLPSPALRRYLNPQSSPISATELSMQLHNAFMIDADSDPHAPMIQMQTYDRRGRSSKSRRRASDPLSEAGRASSSPPAVRQREPRENSDFLRVIVLEMNMRRVGKLDTKAVGRARIWLPPRKLGSNKTAPIVSANSVPHRWAGVSAE